MNQHIISFAGAGRVACTLCMEFYKAKFSIDMIASPTEMSGRSLADSCNAKWSPDLMFPDSTEVIIIAVPDHKLSNVLDKLRCGSETLVAHTAGSIGIDVFPEHIKRKGIIYPLQTFTKGRNINFENLPFLLEASDEQSAAILQMLVESIGGKVSFADSEKRRLLHLAAVFTSNFTNHMLTIGKDITLKAGFSFEILGPLIKETISKSVDLGPEASQTGPAMRNDQITIGKHLKLLSFEPELQKIYIEITRAIMKKHNIKD